MDSVYRMLGAVGGCGWQLRPLGWCLEANLMVAEPSSASLLQPSGACLEVSWSPHGSCLRTMDSDPQWTCDLSLTLLVLSMEKDVIKPNLQPNFLIMC